MDSVLARPLWSLECLEMGGVSWWSEKGKRWGVERRWSQALPRGVQAIYTSQKMGNSKNNNKLFSIQECSTLEQAAQRQGDVSTLGDISWQFALVEPYCRRPLDTSPNLNHSMLLSCTMHRQIKLQHWTFKFFSLLTNCSSDLQCTQLYLHYIHNFLNQSIYVSF